MLCILDVFWLYVQVPIITYGAKIRADKPSGK